MTAVVLAAVSPLLVVPLVVFVLLLMLVPFARVLLGAVMIGERQVGIVVKRFGSRGLEPGRLVALGGESGYQADTLAPGLHFWYWPWQFRVIKVPVVVVPQGEIALVIAAAGEAIPD